MAFLRRGYVPHHYEGPPRILFQTLSGEPHVIDVAKIHCFEEHSIPKAMRPFTTVYFRTRQFVALESFDEIVAKLNVKAVANGNA